MSDSIDKEFLLTKLAEGTLSTEYGFFKIVYFTDGADSAIALIRGEIEGKQELICRIHSSCLFSSAFFSKECNCADQMRTTMEEIEKSEYGIIIYLFHEGRGNGLPAMISTLDLLHQGRSQIEAYAFRGYPSDRRTYDIAAKILRYYNICSVNLFSRNIDKIHTLQKYNISVASKVAGYKYIIKFSDKVRNELTYAPKTINPLSHLDIDDKVVIISDLNVDYIYDLKALNSSPRDNQSPAQRELGGCAYNSAIAFREQNLDPIIIGSVGRDNDGAFIIQELENYKIPAFISQNDGKTGRCSICYSGVDRVITYDDVNANIYDDRLIRYSIRSISLSSSDVIFLTSHLFFRAQTSNVDSIFSAIYESKAKIVLDLVPHDLYKKLTFEKISNYISSNIDILITEYRTLCLLLDKEASSELDKTIIEEFLYNLNVHYLVLRFGIGEISKEAILEKRGQNQIELVELCDTGYESLDSEKRKGFGDILTAKIIKKYL